ncbi:response regulator transcription factor [Amycolatopsis sp. A133]|uniref:response regulator transcription factor n=1 Tax=Amycolatopsis sp. A133 TaxID=3064472 RepID=UPI0027F49D1C|nr:response regulator transcription factor [Amycolatopsis sp. A133]MDQ7808313.1 response regulator transcription factor [Amycolatopsis sp. A133]
MGDLRVLVVDDHPLFRIGVGTLLAAEPGIAVVGEAASGAEAVEAAAALHPDVVVMDLHLPDLSGIQATRHIVAANPGTGVLMLTMADESESVFAAMRAGARGYLLKDAEPDEIVRAVQAVARREAIFGPDIANRVLAFFNQPPPASEPVFPELTGREREVLALIAAGHSNSLIASTLCLSPKTVRNHISNVFAKLHVADRAEAIVRARDAGLGRSVTSGASPRAGGSATRTPKPKS